MRVYSGNVSPAARWYNVDAGSRDRTCEALAAWTPRLDASPVIGTMIAIPAVPM